MFNSKTYIRKLAATGVLAALSTILMYLEFSVPFVPSFLEFDFSDLPALIAAFGVGPLAGVAVELIKNILHLPVTVTAGVGEFANFLLGTCLVLPAGLIYKYVKGKKGALLGCAVGTVLMSACSLPVNYYITYPVYMQLLPLEVILDMYKALNPAANTLWKALLIFNLPFTAAKGVIATVITFLTYKKISPILHGKNN